MRKQTVCEYEELTVQCPGQSRIIMKEAEYGHIGISKCIDADIGHFGCKVNVLEILDGKCSGQQTCKIVASDPSLMNLNPCMKGLRIFLQFSYICVAGR